MARSAPLPPHCAGSTSLISIIGVLCVPIYFSQMVVGGPGNAYWLFSQAFLLSLLGFIRLVVLCAQCCAALGAPLAVFASSIASAAVRCVGWACQAVLLVPLESAAALVLGALESAAVLGVTALDATLASMLSKGRLLLQGRAAGCVAACTLLLAMPAPDLL